LANGTVLDRDLAVAAIEPLAGALGMSVDDTARGIVEIATASMANAIAEITIDQGEDPRQAVLMAFGGAGPLFATLLARQLDIGRMVVPPHAGNFSAYGLLVTDLIQSHARTLIRRVADDMLEDGNETLAKLFETLDDRRAGGRQDDASELAREVALDMRYVGQEHTITVAVPCSPDGSLGVSAPGLLALFASQYEKTYGSTMDEQVEILTWRATVRTRLPRRGRQRAANGQAPASMGDGRTLPAYSFTAAGVRDFAIVDRSTLQSGAVLDGPAIILEDTATTYLDGGFSVELDRSGALAIADRREQP
jgi:N-methylhydantoinase A